MKIQFIQTGEPNAVQTQKTNLMHVQKAAQAKGTHAGLYLVNCQFIGLLFTLFCQFIGLHLHLFCQFINLRLWE